MLNRNLFSKLLFFCMIRISNSFNFPSQKNIYNFLTKLTKDCQILIPLNSDKLLLPFLLVPIDFSLDPILLGQIDKLLLNTCSQLLQGCYLQCFSFEEMSFMFVCCFDVHFCQMKMYYIINIIWCQILKYPLTKIKKLIYNQLQSKEILKQKYIEMNKSTNNYRRCQYCPHHNDKPQCCCQNRKSIISVKTKNKISNNNSMANNTANFMSINDKNSNDNNGNGNGSRSRNCSKNTKKRYNNFDQSTISYINSTLPITNHNTSHNNNYPNVAMPQFNSTILAQNSVLRTENDILKRELQSCYCVSAFMKDQRNISTLHTSENETSRTFQLHDKLYLSNRNLQQALLQLDNLSKTNQHLHEQNTKLQIQKQQLHIRNQQILEQNQRLKKKVKKMNRMIDEQQKRQQMQQPSKNNQFRKILQLNLELEHRNCLLKEEIEELKEEVRRKQSRMVVEVQNLSPEWVAHTSTKINAIEKNISKLQQQNKQNIQLMQNNVNIPTSSSYFPNKSLVPTTGILPQQQQLKTQLITTLKFLKLQSHSFNTFKLTSAFDQLLYNSSNNSLLLLIKSLCQALVEPLQMYFIQLQKDLERSLKNYQSKFKKVVGRMENAVIKMRNQKLIGDSHGNAYF